MNHAPDIPDDRFTAMTRLDQNRATAQLASKAGVHWSAVRNAIIWGNHSNTQFPDWNHATIEGRPASEVITDHDWLHGPFIATVQERGKAIIEARGLSSALSAANAAIGHARSLYQATAAGEHVSICVRSDGSYGVPQGLISSFGCTTNGAGGWSIVQGLEHDDFAQEKIQISVNELMEEREAVADLLP
jgi:malate dehydrogenase